MHHIKCFFIRVVKLFILPIAYAYPRDRKVILFTGTSLTTYNENTRYLFEYLTKNREDLKPYWVTTSKKISSHVGGFNGRVVNPHSIRGIFIFLRAGIYFGTGVSYYNLLNCLTPNRVIKINLYHASGVRQTNAGWEDDTKAKRKYLSSKEIIKHMNRWTYVNFTSKYMDMYFGRICLLLPKNKRIVLGYPRNDHLLGLTNIASRVERVILYAPTWRINEPDNWFPMDKLGGFSFDALNALLVESGYKMIVSVHPHSQITNYSYGYSNIKLVEEIFYDRELFDINDLLSNVDILITDYSSIATDFLLTGRPVLFSLHDYEEFLLNRGLLIDFKEKLPGYEVHTINDIKLFLQGHNNHKPENFDANVDYYLNKFYDRSIDDSVGRIEEFVDGLIG